MTTLALRSTVGAIALGVAAGLAAPVRQTPERLALAQVARGYLWPATDVEGRAAEAALAADASLASASRTQFHDLEAVLRQGPPLAGAAPLAGGDDELSVDVPGGATLPVLVRLPPRYSAETEWPLMYAMHGGPPGTAQQARSGAERMIKVWTDAAAAAGWVVAAPAMTTVVAADKRTEDRLPYEILYPEQARSVIAAVRARYRINPDRIVSTGISLGSNFSIAFAAGHPDWFAGIVPVSTEGDSRELLLRNLTVPVYVLEGSRDRNIRAIDGPRAIGGILQRFGYDLTYREFGDRAHEGFQEHYGDVLRWLDARPRQVYPREVWRVPHTAIVPVSRRVHWIESDTRQGLVHAAVTSPTTIEITARWARELKVYLHDRLVDLDRPIEIRVNGITAFSGKVARSVRVALEQARALGDERRIYANVVTVSVPTSAAASAEGERLWKSLTPQHREGPLSFWEMYAVRALEERFPGPGFDGVQHAAPVGARAMGEQRALRVTRVDPGSAVAAAGLRRDDLLLEFSGEPFFAGAGVERLYSWLVRELRASPQQHRLVVWRGGRREELIARLQLGSYRTQTTAGAPPR